MPISTSAERDQLIVCLDDIFVSIYCVINIPFRYSREGLRQK